MIGENMENRTGVDGYVIGMKAIYAFLQSVYQISGTTCRAAGAVGREIPLRTLVNASCLR